MWMSTRILRPVCPVRTGLAYLPNRRPVSPSSLKPGPFQLRFRASASKKEPSELRTHQPGLNSGSEKFSGIANSSVQEEDGTDGSDSGDVGWLPAFPHVLVASMSNFLFGYHIGVMNGPIVSVARELGFEGDSILEGLVVSIFIVGAFLGSICSGAVVDKLGCRRTLQIDTVPLILGALISAQAHSLDEVLLGRFLVGLGIGVNTVLVPIYISEIAPTKYRGSLGTLCQIGTCIGIIASLFLGLPSESDPHWWRTMLYIASIPGFVLILGMQYAVDSPRWLLKVGRTNDAKEIIRNLWGESEVESAINEFQAVIKSDGSDVNSSWLELVEEPHSRGCVKVVFRFQVLQEL